MLAATFLVCGLLFGPEAAPDEVDRLSAFALGVYLLAAAFLTLASEHDPVALTAFVVLTVATVAIAWRAEAATGAVPVAAILAMAVMAHWAVLMNLSQLLWPGGPAAPAVHEPQRYDYGSHLVVAAGWAALFGVTGFLAQGRSLRALAPMLWCASGVFAPLAMLVALYYRIAGSRSIAAIRRLGAAARRDLCARHRKPHPARRPAGHHGRKRDVRNRRARGAGAGAHLRAGERLAHRRACADGSGGGLGRAETAAAVAALARCHRRRHRGGACRL